MTNLDTLIDNKIEIEKEISYLQNNNREKISQETNEEINKKMLVLKDIENQLNQLCHHNWIEDIIDEPLRSWNICYCSHCFSRK